MSWRTSKQQWIQLSFGTAIVIALLFANSSCKRKREYNGIGGWILGKTTRSAAGGICEAQAGLVWCGSDPLSNRTVSLGGQPGDIGLYFASDEPDAPLVEIVLDVASCDLPNLTLWMTKTFGKPSQSHPPKSFWSGGHAFIALIPKETGDCEVSLVAASDKKRIAELLAGT